MQRKGNAIWRGGFKNGKGELSTESGSLKNVPYSVGTRFENIPGANPEELIGAAHAGCFLMALSGNLEKKGYVAETLEASATVTVEKKDSGYTITSSKLKLRAQVPDLDAKTFQTFADDAKINCPVSKLLKTEISLDIDFHSPLRAGLSH
ncbi:MAG: OsmC family protein [Pseudobdellovibrionaceae bacterium]